MKVTWDKTTDLLRRAPLAVLIALTWSLNACQEHTFREGERLFMSNCANCHMDDGIGLSALIPPLAGSDYLKSHRDRLPCILRKGLSDTIYVNGRMYAEQMPGVPTLSDIQVTNLLNFINNSWGNRNGIFRLDEVQRALATCGNADK